jgi:hypothetical protein
MNLIDKLPTPAAASVLASGPHLDLKCEKPLA